MKKIVLIALFAFTALASRAQFPGNITIINNMPCDMTVALMGIDQSNPNPCSLNYGSTPFVVHANSFVICNVFSVLWSYGSPLPPPPTMLWEAARVYDKCNLPGYNATVGDPACYQTNGTGNACCGPYFDIWDPIGQTLTIN